jgi:hypothetical protein
MKDAFVAYQSGVSLDELKQQLQVNETVYYYLQYVDRIEGFSCQLPERLLSSEGRMFNASLELRWTQNREGYDLLWLGTQPPPGEFQTMAGDWEYCDRPAKVYPSSETRLPKGVPEFSSDFNLQQRYFVDRDTAIVHFVALTVN